MPLAQALCLLQRCRKEAAAPLADVRVGGCRVNLLLRRISGDSGRSLGLTAGEFALLAGLIRHREHVISGEALLAFPSSVDDAYQQRDARTGDTFIGRLRRKLGGGQGRTQLIQTLYGRTTAFSTRICREPPAQRRYT